MTQRPNILLIVVDQQRLDCIGRSNIYPVMTPNIDRLAREGMWFNNTYTPIPLCCPARMSLLNGRRPESFGAYWNYDITMPIYSMRKDEYTFTKELSQSGYKQAYIGKWHVSPEFTPTDFGFDYYYSSADYESFLKKENLTPVYKNGWLGETDPLPTEYTRTHVFAEEVIKKIEEYKEDTFHIRLDFEEPHLPCRPATQFLELYKDADIEKWGSFDDDFHNKPYIQKQQLLNWRLEDYTWEDWREVVRRYYAVITQVDDAIGRVLDCLDKNGLNQNTIVIFTSDHGDMCGAHKMMDKHYNMYEDIVRVPMVVKWEGVVKPGSVCDDYIHNCLDIAPTICDAAGLAKKDFFHGKSFYKTLLGEEEQDKWAYVVSTYNGQQFGLYNMRMIAQGNIKYIWNPTDMDELYDLKNDPYELENEIYNEKYKDVLCALRKTLYQELIRCEDGLFRRPHWINGQLLEGRKI